MHPSFYFNSSSGRAPLRIGLLLNDSIQPAWVAEVLEQIAQSNFARVELVVYNAKEKARHSPLRRMTRLLSDAKARRVLLFRLYARWDRRRIASGKDPFRKKDLSARLKNIDAMRLVPLGDGPVDRFASDAIEQIRVMNLDVLLRFGFNILRGEILTAARCGVWSYHHGDNDFYRGGPPCFWEMVEGNLITGAMLQVLTEELDAGRVLCKGSFATSAGGSWTRNRVQPYWGACTFVIQKLHQLHEQGWDAVEKQIVPAEAYRGTRRIYKAPLNGEMARWLLRQLARKTLAVLQWLPRRLRTDHWKLAIRTGARIGFTTGSTTGLISGTAQDAGQFQWIDSPKGHFYADPFLFSRQGQRWLFFEDFDYRSRLGSIAAAEVSASGALSTAVRVLERPYHLSYPGVFQVDDQLYMIPETRSNGTVEMYRCSIFPDKWELAKVFLQAPAVDTTAWSENGVHWFFVTLREPRGGALQLWLFFSAGILDDWRPHPANPISTDVRSSRGGGAIYRDGERLIRPSQDCSGNYGRSFTLNEILVLNESEYHEMPLVTLKAPKGMIGTHTYACVDDIEAIDGCANISIFRVMDKRTIMSRLRNKVGMGRRT
jgi:hypothetical protein